MRGFVGEDSRGATGAEYTVEYDFGEICAGIDAASGVFSAYD